MKNEDLFEALSELDEELIAKAKHIDTYGEQTVVLRRTPVWKIVTGFAAAAACVAALAVGGVLGMKYINGKNAVSPPSDSSGDVSYWVSSCKAYATPEYPERAEYVYSGDYSEISLLRYGIVDRIARYDLITLEESSDLIVIGEFVDDPHQCYDPDDTLAYRFLDRTSWEMEYSFNRFRIDKVVKGDRSEGEEIIIYDDGFVHDGEYYCISNLTPMVKGDRWIYFLRSGHNEDGNENGYYSASWEGRYPVPGSEHEFALNDNVYGVFDMSEFQKGIYEDIKERLPDWTYEVYFRADYPEYASDVYSGDYSGLNVEQPDVYWNSDKKLSYDEVWDNSEFIVTGEFIDDTHQYIENANYANEIGGRSFNKFKVDKVFKGDIQPGQIIIIAQESFVINDTLYINDNLTPMIKGDKWLYCLSKSGGICNPRGGNGRYPIPGSGNKSLDFTDGYYGVYDTQYANKEVYERLLNELDIAVTKDFDGVVLSVMTDGKNFGVNDDIRVTATVRNTTDKPIGLLTPVLGDGSHTEISTVISRGRCSLVDIDVVDKCFDDALGSHIVQPGEEYVQEMTFHAVVMDMIDSIPSDFEPGEFKGTATIKLLSDPDDVTGEVTERVVEFALNIGDKSSVTHETKSEGKGVVTVMRENGDLTQCKWTMDEFPGIDFTGDDYVVYTMDGNGDWEHLYTADRLDSIYLFDLNGDGKREIISTARFGNATSIRLYDYANRQGYTLEDIKKYNYEAVCEDGGIHFKKTAYSDGKYIDSGVLSLDNPELEKMEVYSLGTVGGGVQKIELPYKSDCYNIEFEMSEFKGVTFHAQNLGGSGHSVGWTDGKMEHLLYYADIITDLYLCDLNGDGYRELCSTADSYKPSKTAILAFDFRNNIRYELSDDENSYWLEIDDSGRIMQGEKRITGSSAKYNELSLGVMRNMLHPLKSFNNYIDMTGEPDKAFFEYYCEYTPEDHYNVYSITPGKVVYSSKQLSAVIVEFEGKLYCYYGLDKINVGDKVTVDQAIGEARYTLRLGIVASNDFNEYDLEKIAAGSVSELAIDVSRLVLPIVISGSEYVLKYHSDGFYFCNADGNAKVVSFCEGEVVAADRETNFNGGCGRYVAVLDDAGWYHYYSHLGGVSVNVGDRLTAGQQIGTVGNSGKWLPEYGFGVRYSYADHMLDLSVSGD